MKKRYPLPVNGKIRECPDCGQLQILSAIKKAPCVKCGRPIRRDGIWHRPKPDNEQLVKGWLGRME